MLPSLLFASAFDAIHRIAGEVAILGQCQGFPVKENQP
jgi:hypothetical protein